jgi:hypothetical protein
MKMQIIIDVPSDIDVNTDIQQIIKDALNEFRQQRMPHFHYVEKRYPYFDDNQKRTKRREVENRCNIAERLVYHITVKN